MKKLIAFLTTALGVLLWVAPAHASHFRYGTISWRVPDPQNAPRTVEFVVQQAWRTALLDCYNLNFGDGQTGNGCASVTNIGTGVDAGGASYTLREFTETHTYATAASFLVFFENCCRIGAPLQNGASNTFRVETLVNLTGGNTGGPVMASPPIRQLQIGGTRTAFFPFFDPDGDSVSCRLATDAEAGFTGSVPSVGGQTPVITTVAGGCLLTWNVTAGTAGNQYVVHIVADSTHSGSLSSGQIDLLIELVNQPPPTCAGTGTFIVNTGVPFSTVTTGSLTSAGNLTASALNMPAGATFSTPLTGAQPLSNTFSWTPPLSAAGTTTIVTVNYTNSGNLSGTCFLTIQVPQCANYGAPCTVGTGACQASGTNVCAGPGITVCSATAGTPTPEICDNIDNNCDGSVDNNPTNVGLPCFMGLPGVCDAGLTVCLPGGALACDGIIDPNTQPETCDTLDNDCDGAVDDGFNTGGPCTNGVGACQTSGVVVCAGPNGTTCNAVPGTPTAELCDGIDNDCDGATDNGFNLGMACTNGLGVCQTSGQIVCDGLGGATCNAVPGMPTAESCDNLDNDCDGVADNGDPGGGVSCATGLFGICSTGVTLCTGGNVVCDPDFTPGAQPEVCGDALDSDCDGLTDNGCTDDTDGDGLKDVDETQNGTDPLDADSDDDGVPDGQEPDVWEDTDGDGLINGLDPDSDNDGLYDGTELGLDCSGPDTDVAAGHCTPDGDSGATVTDPLDADTDDGGVRDGQEDLNLNGVIDVGETDPTAGHGDDDINEDTDGDGLTDDFEISIGTDPNDADSDDDGLIDGDEANPADDTDGDGAINALDPDSDDDGLFDGTEVGKDCSDPDTDASAGNCIADGDSGATTTSPVDPDTDDGTVIDGDEDANHNGVLDQGETDPTAGHGDDDLDNDLDGDGITNDDEILIGTDPNDADSDDDGVLDGDEPDFDKDTDGDGTINALDPDSDDDGLFDGTELGLDCNNAATDTTSGNCIPDADGGETTTDPLDADTDDGGVSDGEEDTNLDGAIDVGERNPNDPTDDNPECDTDADCGGLDSGRVCNETHHCVDGCRGEDGNGCPSGEECSSDDASIGVCEESDVTVHAEGNGVFCAAAPASSRTGDAMAFGLVSLLGLVLVRRRQNARKHRKAA
ncbi:MAG: MopE-related protein [Polyangiaceae bacterium]